jgi:hypothetical protein
MKKATCRWLNHTIKNFRQDTPVWQHFVPTLFSFLRSYIEQLPEWEQQLLQDFQEVDKMGRPLIKLLTTAHLLATGHTHSLSLIKTLGGNAHFSKD